ncbi:MAG: ATP-binding protein [Rhizobiaceae bacterium]|nr:ATP-binding protein [Rhizobiaceae bacterium]
MSGESEEFRYTGEPVIDELKASAGIGRFLLLGLFLFIGVAALGYFGVERLGEPIFIIFLAIFASVGVFFLFSLALGILQFGSRSENADFSKQLLGQMDPGIVVSDANNRVLFANDSYAKLIGASGISDISGVEIVFSKHPEASDAVYKMSSAVRNGKSSVEEIRLNNGLIKSGEGAKWYRLRSRPMKLQDREDILTVWQVSDVTEDRFEQENSFQQLQDAIHYLDHAPAGFIASEPDGTIVYLNATLADWLGVDLAMFEPSGSNIRDMIPADNEALFDTADIEAGNAKTTVVDLDMNCADGRRLPVRMYHRIPMNADGAPGTARTLILNRASTFGGDNALQEAEIRFTRFFNNTPVAIAGLDGDGRVVRTNASFQKMFSEMISRSNDKRGLKFIELSSADDQERLQKLFDNAISGSGDVDPVEMAIDDNSERFVRFFVSHVADSLDDSNANPERVIVYAVETTEQRALENQFAKGQKMQAVGQLAGGIAHDFNNVLTAIIGFSDLLLTNHKPSDPSFQDIMNIKQNANRAASLVRQLLAFSRRQTLRPQVLHMADVLSDLRMLLDRLVGDRVTLNVKHGRDLWPVKADVSQLEQVLVNLVVNARDAMDDEGYLEIRTRNITEAECGDTVAFSEFVPADYVLIQVEDEGTGMSQDVLDKIFEPFFSTKEVGKGTGLGLSTVYGIIKQTGGFIYPESEEGQGTTFNVFLPRHIPEEKVDASPAEDIEGKQEEPAKDLTGNATILLVEDEDAVRAFGSRALISRGYEVHEAASGVEALEVMEEVGDEIDLVVSDVVMPEMDGPTLLGELRKTYPDLKFIFVSGYAEEAFAKNLPQEERDKFGFLPKPFSLKQLASTVKDMLEE